MLLVKVLQSAAHSDGRSVRAASPPRQLQVGGGRLRLACRKPRNLHLGKGEQSYVA